MLHDDYIAVWQNVADVRWYPRPGLSVMRLLTTVPYTKEPVHINTTSAAPSHSMKVNDTNLSRVDVAARLRSVA